MNAPSMERAARDLARIHGWRVFPLARKKPLKGTHGFHDATNNPQEIRAQFADADRIDGVGIACDSEHGPIVIDVDGPSGQALLNELDLPPTYEVRTGSGKRHLYFAPPESGVRVRRATRVRRNGVKHEVDVLGDGGYVAGAGSIHPDTQQPYRVVADRPLAPLPESIIELVTATASPNGAASQLPKVIHEGERDTLLTSLAGSMRRRGASQEAIYAALQEENRRRVTPPLSEKQVRKIARSIGERPAGSPAEQQLAALNDTYAVIQVGDKVRVLQERGDEFTFLATRDFKLKLADRFVELAEGEKRKPLADVWLTWEGRRVYERVVFAPGSDHVAATDYNLWRGFAVAPSASGSCERFLTHLRENVCGGSRKRYDWLLGWFAQLVQEPARKLGTAVVLRGAQGVGKSIVGQTVGRLLGPHYVTANSPRYVTGRFNSHVERCVLLHAEEAFWAGHKDAEGVLKDLITNATQMIERKGLEPITVANHVRLLVTSNQRWVVPAGFNERRFAVFDVSEAHRQDVAYFSAIQAELDNGGYAKLLHGLLHHAYDERALREVPWTAALREQIVASLTPEDAWLLDMLTSGTIPGIEVDERGRVRVTISALHRAYCAHAKVVGVTHRSDETRFGMWLKDWFPDARRFVAKVYDLHQGKRVSRRTVVLPPLIDARDALGKKLGRTKWGQPTRWLLVNETEV